MFCLGLKIRVDPFSVYLLTLFRLGFFGRPLRFLKTMKDIDMKLTPLTKRRDINLLLLA